MRHLCRTNLACRLYIWPSATLPHPSIRHQAPFSSAVPHINTGSFSTICPLELQLLPLGSGVPCLLSFKAVLWLKGLLYNLSLQLAYPFYLPSGLLYKKQPPRMVLLLKSPDTFLAEPERGYKPFDAQLIRFSLGMGSARVSRWSIGSKAEHDAA